MCISTGGGPEIKKMKHDITQLREDLDAFQDIKNIKKYLISCRLPSQSFFENDAFDDVSLESFFNAG